MSFVRDSVRSLKVVGVQPITLLIPEKVDIYRDKLGAIQPPASREHYYAQIRAQLEALGDKVPDLRAAFLSARQADDIFLKTDTHWTVAGAGVGASEVAAILRADDALSHEAFTLASEPETEHSGDLLKFAKLSVFSHYVPLPVERIGPLSAKTTDANLDDLLAEEPAGPQVAIVGSSYSANATWSFEAQLKAAALDVINFAEEGKGPFKPMEPS